MTDGTRITLVSFSRPDQGKRLHAELSHLGYRVESLSSRTWLESERSRSGEPLVLFMAQPDYPREKILSALHDSDYPCLGVSDRDQASADASILTRCSEFAYWPCHRDELALRVARICRSVMSDGSPPDLPLDEFTELNLIGRSPAFVRALTNIKKLARYDLPVLIQGETGTGKELAARAIHYLSARRNHPFVPVNCGAIPDDLVENELFGHARGAFTDARDAQPGVVALAEHGTLFLDEIEALTPKAQVALLRFLQDRQYRVLGGRALIDADVRVVAAGHEDLAALVKAGRFREDLYFRLNIASLHLPPLRERAGDASLLAEHFCSAYRRRYGQSKKALHPAALRWVEQQQWSGNVRELENFIHRRFVLSDGDTVIVHQEESQYPGQPSTDDSDCEGDFLGSALRDAKVRVITGFERRYLSELLGRVDGNVTQAARRAGTERRALGKLLKKHNIDPQHYRKR